MSAIFEPTEKQRLFVKDSIETGIPYKDIYTALKINERTFTKHFEYEKLTAGISFLNSAKIVVSEALRDGSLDAAKFVLSKRGEAWSDKIDVNNTIVELPKPPIVNFLTKEQVDERNKK